MEIPSQELIATHFLIMNSALSKKSHIFPHFMPQVLSEGMFHKRTAKDSCNSDSEENIVVIV